MSLVVRPIDVADHAEWDGLYAAYAEFYGVEQTAEMRDRVFEWLTTHAHEVNGFCAFNEGEMVGITHYRVFARPLAAATGLFLDDLFVSPEARGTGAAGALIDAVRGEAQKYGHSVVRWITAEDNARARGLYDKIAEQTAWVTYDIKV
ncbi:GNAT family N-acetyltransferase [Octadecabacter sp. 1_MG-2023]|uniref:GNAT family N-acetyltransferase n=1 Tax=unclassified Octadecabacter TaxID=196158 RepID=UPI001C09BAB7|nr:MULTISPECIES: GNAT family N-acetyltransferase [unclassified Octadecabacter]MBU2992029.1 GNAT family N-acetyltransferase [Octadecabacter sp. B2R22]MDO6736004.1 GNAT family N-acetyltransferase [Octadecabacter sp. 1_MG-2023]